MVMRSLREGAKNKIFKTLMFGVLMAATGGLVLSDVGGFFRGGNFGSMDVASIGSERIGLVKFDRELRQILQNAKMSPQEAYKMGFVNQVLASKIREYLVHEAASDLGLSIDKKNVAKRLKDLIAPMVGPGQTEADVLRQILQSQGMSEAELVAAIGRDMASEILADSINGAPMSLNAEAVSDLYRAENETRALDYIRFKDSDVKDIQQPDDAQLEMAYQAMKEEFAIDEIRSFKIYTLQAESIRKSIKISDEELRDEYDSSPDRYNLPARKTIEQALLLQEDVARQVAEMTQKNKNLRAAVEKVTGRSSDYLGLQDFTDEALPEAIRKDVLAADKLGAVIGPLKTPLGWQVAYIKDIRPAMDVSFADAKKGIREELEQTRLQDELFAQATALDDLLAAGTSADEIKKQIPVTVKDITSINYFGKNAKGQEPLKDMPQDLASAVIAKGFDIPEEGQASPAEQMQDGAFTAIQVTALSPKTYKPLEDVKDIVAKRWDADQRRVANQALTSGYAEALAKGEETFEKLTSALGKRIESVSALKKNGEPQAPFSVRSMAMIFDAPLGQPVIVDIDGGKAIIRVTKADLPEKVNTGGEDFARLEDQIQNDTANELLGVYLETKNETYKASVNQDLLERSYGAAQEQN